MSSIQIKISPHNQVRAIRANDPSLSDEQIARRVGMSPKEVSSILATGRNRRKSRVGADGRVVR